MLTLAPRDQMLIFRGSYLPLVNMLITHVFRVICFNELFNDTEQSLWSLRWGHAVSRWFDGTRAVSVGPNLSSVTNCVRLTFTEPPLGRDDLPQPRGENYQRVTRFLHWSNTKKKTISETSVLNILGVGAATQAVMSVLSVAIWGSWWVPLMFESLSSATSVTVAKLWFRHSFTRYQLYLLPPTYALFKSFLKGFRPYLLPATWAVSVFFYIQRQHDYWRCKV